MKWASITVSILLSAAVAAAVDTPTTEPEPPDREAPFRVLAQRYEDVLIPAFKLSSEQASELRAKLQELVAVSVTVDDRTRGERRRILDEIAEIEAGTRPTSLRSRRRVAHLYGLLENMYVGAPLEPRSVGAAISGLVPKEMYDRAGRIIVDARQRYAQPPGDVPLRDVAPGSPAARAALVLERYRSFKKTGFFEGAKDLPAGLEPTDVVKVDVPQFYPTAPPVGEWKSCVEGFVKALGLDVNQAAAARRIADDSVERAESILKGIRPEIEAANKLADAEFRAAVLADLNRPLDELFDEMKLRVYGVATADQRERATSRPAAGG